MSPRYLREKGARSAKRMAWEGTAKVLELAQRRSVQLSVVGAGALFMLLGNRDLRRKMIPRKRVETKKEEAAAAARTVGASLLWMLINKAWTRRNRIAAEKPAVSGAALAATAARAFFSGARSTKKTGTTRPGRKEAWRGLATSLGAALGSYWFSHRPHRV